MRDRTYIILLVALLITSTAFLLGFLAGRDSTVISFRGLPDNAVIHFEVGPAKATSITGIVLYYMTGWFLIPISAEAIVADASGIENVHNSQFTVNNSIYNLQGVRLSGLQKGLNIVNGKKVVIK